MRKSILVFFLFLLMVGIVIAGRIILKQAGERDGALRAQNLSIQGVIYSDNLGELNRRFREEGVKAALSGNVEAVLIDLVRDEELVGALRMILDYGGGEYLSEEAIDRVYVESGRWGNIEAMKIFSERGIIPTRNALSGVDSDDFDRYALKFLRDLVQGSQ